MSVEAGLLSKYRAGGILIDTNILLMILVGAYNPDRIPSFKRTAAYTVADFHLAVKLVQYMANVITTPSILAEVSNLSGQLDSKERFEYFSSFGWQIQKLLGIYVESVDVVRTDEFLRLGLTDAGIVELARRGRLVLTDDLPLFHRLMSMELPTLNFNHIRMSSLLS